LVSKAHENKIPTAIPMFAEVNFSITIIFILLGVAVTLEINMADKNAKVVSAISVWHVLLTSQQCKTAIVCFAGCGRHGSSINTVKIYCKSIFQYGNHKLEVL